jgi:hypothetical protein
MAVKESIFCISRGLKLSALLKKRPVVIVTFVKRAWIFFFRLADEKKYTITQTIPNMQNTIAENTRVIFKRTGIMVLYFLIYTPFLSVFVSASSQKVYLLYCAGS